VGASRRWSTLLAASAAVFSFTSKSTAAENEEPIRFDYTAPTQCPAAELVLAQIRSYTTGWTLAPPGTEARRFIVRITQDDSSYVGRFDLTTTSDDPGLGRDIRGDDCEDVAAGLAVAVALAIDPGALDAAAPFERSDDPSPPLTPSGSRVDRSPAHRSGSAPKPMRGAEVSIGGRADAVGAVSGVLGTMQAFVEVGWHAPFGRASFVRPALRAGYKQSFPRTASVGQSSADISWRAGFVEACLVRFELPSDISIDGCVGSNIGQLSAEAHGLRDARLQRRFWLDYGAVLGARWQLHPRLFVELVGGVWFPVTRERFRVEPDGVVSLAPPWGPSLGLGGGWRF